MNRMVTKLAAIGIGALVAVSAQGQSSDALIVLTTVGYLTGNRQLRGVLDWACHVG